MLNEYNSTIHRTHGLKPTDVTQNDEKQLLSTVYNYEKQLCIPKYSKNQPVRVSRYKSVFHKSYKVQWSPEIFQIHTISRKCPVTYILRDYNNEIIKGRWYEPEIQPVKFKNGYLVEKILARKKNKVLIKWWGMDDHHSTWEDEKNVF